MSVTLLLQPPLLCFPIAAPLLKALLQLLQVPVPPDQHCTHLRKSVMFQHITTAEDGMLACQCSKRKHEWEGRTCVQPAASGVPALALAATERAASASSFQATTLAWRQQRAARRQATSCFHLASAACRAACPTCRPVSASAQETMLLLQMILLQHLFLLDSEVGRQQPPGWADPRCDLDAVLQTPQAQLSTA